MESTREDVFSILIVDDTPANLYMLERILLQLAGVEVVRAGSGKEALAHLESREFGLAIIDVEMPAINGYDLLLLMRANPTTARLPVIFLSAIYAEEYQHRAEFDSGPVDLMTKPIQMDLLLSKVRVFMRMEQQRRQLQAMEMASSEPSSVDPVDVQRALDEIVESWAKALELREFGVQGHGRRVVEMTLRLAGVVGIDSKEHVHIRRGALLHDVGKMVVPDYILIKPGPLTEQERSIIQRHPVFAYELMRVNEFLRPAIDIPYSHHERWDGTGYPRRLKGEEIPLSARIFQIADVWDCLNLDRPYRPAWLRSEAVQYLRRNAGSEFDPDLVEVFLSLLHSG